MPHSGTARGKGNRAPARRERFADRRRARYDGDTNNHLTPLANLPTEVKCLACTKGHGVIIGKVAGRVQMECDYCSRRFYLLPESWRP